MKSKVLLLITITGFLALFACINPIIEELYYIGEETIPPVIPLAVTYTVDFDTNGGSFVDSQKVAKGEKATRPQNPTKVEDGIELGFVNWYDNEDLADPHYDFDTPVIGDLTLYADWSLNSYTVIFMDGEIELYRQLVGKNGTASRPDPTKEGYTFDDWYTDSEMNDVYDFDTLVTSGIILYAKWTINTYTVTFMDGDTPLSELTQNPPHGTAVSRPETDPVKDGHTFDDWYGEEELTDAYDFGTLITDDTIVYAKFNIKTYTVTFMDGDTVLSGLTRNAIPHGSTVGRPPNPTKDGYIFDNWYSNSGFTTLFSFSTPITDNTTLYAKFNIKTYTVIFMDGDTVLAGLTKTVTHDSTVSRPSDPTKDGYDFADWYSDSELTAVYDFDTPVTVGITLYAKWTLKTYTVTFMDGDAVLSALTQTVAHGSTVNRPSDPTKDGYDIFDNWYADSVLVTSFNFSTPIIENKTVYSRWLDSDFPGQTIHNRFNVSNFYDWNDAVDTISRGGDNKNYIINVIADFSVSSTAYNHFGAPKGIKVSLRGVGRIMTWTGKGYMLHVESGQTLILRDLTLQGNKSNNDCLVFVKGTSFSSPKESTFIMQSGKICGNSSGWYAGGVGVETGGIFIMNDGEISDNIARNGGGVNVYEGTFTMNGGIISLNSAFDGGGVNVDEEGTFAMYGGKISRNVATYSGGGVYVFGKSFTMYGGEISNNNSAASSSDNGGGGVLVNWGTTFRIVTGTIYGYNHPSLSNYANLADDNSGAALLMREGGTAQYGKFNGSTWLKTGDLNTTNNTIKVVNGTMINE